MSLFAAVALVTAHVVRAEPASVAGVSRAPAEPVLFTPALAPPPVVHASYRVSFPWRDAELLLSGEANGAHVVVPARAAGLARAPLVVLLHGVNVDRGIHMWMGGPSMTDLGAMSDRLVAAGALPPFILAAPSQTRAANRGRTMWTRFDLDAFVDAVDAATAGHGRVDRTSVIVVGHSGAGCNPDGGILHVARTPWKNAPRAIVAVDTCIDEETGDGLGRAPPETDVVVRWQPEIWPRPIPRFRSVFSVVAATSGRDEPLLQRVDGLGGSAHDAILVDTFASSLAALVAPRADEGDVVSVSEP